MWLLDLSKSHVGPKVLDERTCGTRYYIIFGRTEIQDWQLQRSQVVGYIHLQNCSKPPPKTAGVTLSCAKHELIRA